MVDCDLCGKPDALTFILAGDTRKALCPWHQRKYSVGRYRYATRSELVIFTHDLWDRVKAQMKEERVKDTNVMLTELIHRGLSVGKEVLS